MAVATLPFDSFLRLLPRLLLLCEDRVPNVRIALAVTLAQAAYFGPTGVYASQRGVRAAREMLRTDPDRDVASLFSHVS